MGSDPHPQNTPILQGFADETLDPTGISRGMGKMSRKMTPVFDMGAGNRVYISE
jgi:hypothetical protein